MNALVPTMPAALVYLVGRMIPQHRQDFFSVIRDGQLLFVAVALLAATVSDAMKEGKHLDGLALAIILVLLLIILGLFVPAALVRDTMDDATKKNVGQISLALLGIVTAFVMIIRAYTGLF